MKTKRNDDWREQAERLGQNLAEGLERFGDRVAKAIETIEQKVGPQIKKATGGVGVDDKRAADGQSVAVKEVGKGDVFDLKGALYMRLGELPNAPGDEQVDAVQLRSGNVSRFEPETMVVQVDATLVVNGESDKTEKTDTTTSE